MRIFNKQWLVVLGLTASLFLGAANVDAGVSTSAEKYFKEFPFIGLVSNKITYGPITISKVDIHNGDKLAVVAPGETLKGSLKYKINSDKAENFQAYHLLIGIDGEGAQDCVAHSAGLWDSKGRSNFTLVAPTKPGVYQVRFLFAEGILCQDAKNVWNDGDQEPSSKATIGVIIVE